MIIFIELSFTMRYSTLKILMIFYVGITLSSGLIAQNFGLYINNEKGKTTIPFKQLNNLIIFQLRINNIDSLSFILDTGVKNTILLDKQMADSLNLKAGRDITITGAGKKDDIEAFVVPEIDINSSDLAGKVYSLIVLKDDSLHLEELFGIKIHGIIGYDIFNRFIVNINYDLNRITLFERNSFKPRRSWSGVPIEIINSKPHVRCSLTMEDLVTEEMLMLDLGATHACLIELGKDEKDKLPDKHIECKLGRGLAGEFYGYKSRYKKLKVGNFEFKNPIISFTDIYSPPDSSTTKIRSGTLGGEIFSRLNITFDYNGNIIYIKKNLNFNKKFEHNLSGIDVVAKGNQLNVFIVNEIRVGSAAYYTGLQKGDHIFCINGELTRNMKIDEIHAILHSRPGRKIDIIVLRNGHLFNYSFRLKRDI